MDDEAAILLARTHATLVRQLSEVAGHHFEGLHAAARYKSLNLTNRQRRQLCHLDIAFKWSRHVTSVKCATLTAEILKHVSPVPAATCAATAACAPVQQQNVESIKEGPQERAQHSTVEQIVRVPAPQIQEQVIVQGIPGAQVVKRIRWKRAQQRTVEQIVRVPVPTVQEQMIVQEIPRAQVVKRIRVNIVETIPQERVQQRTDEQIVRVPVPSVQKQMCVPVKSGAQVMERIPEHIVESFDQEELDQLRHDWLMGAFEHPDF